jgi:hypothetical protein
MVSSSPSDRSRSQVWVLIYTINTYHPRFIPDGVVKSSQILQYTNIYQNDLAMRNTADVTDGKLIAVWSQSISGVSDDKYY